MNVSNRRPPKKIISTQRRVSMNVNVMCGVFMLVPSRWHLSVDEHDSYGTDVDVHDGSHSIPNLIWGFGPTPR
jgi:hypothetical protein